MAEREREIETCSGEREREREREREERESKPVWRETAFVCVATLTHVEK